jgi:CubicO group peptidase (beta-lactamase class C family)
METIRALKTLTGVLFAAAIMVNAAPGASLLDKATIDSALSGFIDSHALVGISALVYEDGHEAYFGAFGEAGREAGKPMTRDTVYSTIPEALAHQ